MPARSSLMALATVLLATACASTQSPAAASTTPAPPAPVVADWLPADAQVVARLDVAEVRGGRLGQRAMSFLDELVAEDPQDEEAAGWREVLLGTQQALLALRFGPGEDDAEGVLAVELTPEAADLAWTLLAAEARTLEVGGYPGLVNADDADEVLFRPLPDVVVFCSSGYCEAAATPPSARPSPGNDVALPPAPLAVGMRVTEDMRANLRTAFSEGGEADAMSDAVLFPVVDELRTGALSLTAAEQMLDVHVELVFSGEGPAHTAGLLLKAALESVRQEAPEIVRQMLAYTTITTEGAVVAADLPLNVDALEAMLTAFLVGVVDGIGDALSEPPAAPQPPPCEPPGCVEEEPQCGEGDSDGCGPPPGSLQQAI